MAQHGHKEDFKIEESFEFSGKKKRNAFVFIGLGVVLLALGVLLQASGFSLMGDHGHGEHAEAPYEPVDESMYRNRVAQPDEVEGHYEDQTQELHDADEVKTKEKAAMEHGNEENEHKEEHSDEEGHGSHGGGHHGPTWLTRLWANLWMNNVFFLGIGVVGIFFLAANYVGYAGWHIALKRVPEALAPLVYFMGPLLLIFFFAGGHEIFHWRHEGIMDPESANYDEIIAGKEWWLNLPFYIGRMVVFVGLWILIASILRKFSKKEDLEGHEKTGTYDKSIWWSALFLVIFAVSSSVFSWDWVMSIDTHWFSTLFGWYMFASWFVSGLAVITLVVLFLKDQGYLSVVNENHLHDMGKYMFAFSIFWTYLFFAQFLLYYYANIPEEVFYYRQRMWSWDMKYFGLFIGMVFINFIFPFLVLMTRGSKRRPMILKVVAFAILIGHYLDFYLMVMPGTMKDQAGFGFIEIGSLLLFIGICIYVVSHYLSKANLVPKKDPMLEESLHHHI